MNIEPMIVVSNVERSSQFYQQVLGLESAHGGDEYEMLTYQNRLVLQLHRSDAHEHPAMWQANAVNGNGVILWFRTGMFTAAVETILNSEAVIVAEPHINPNAKQHEIWFRDPDGYLVVVSDHFGNAA
ncbi:MAG: VOC family protein [Pseudomonadota bacterium]|nr:VOC family protein [Pseudomonadota bacterium]